MSRSASQMSNRQQGVLALADIRDLNLPNMHEYFAPSSASSKKHATATTMIGGAPVPEFTVFSTDSASSCSVAVSSLAPLKIEPTKIPSFVAALQAEQDALANRSNNSATKSRTLDCELEEPAADSPSRRPVATTAAASGLPSRGQSNTNSNSRTSTSPSVSVAGFTEPLPPFVPGAASPSMMTLPQKQQQQKQQQQHAPIVDEQFLEQHIKAVQDYYETRLQEMERELIKQRDLNSNSNSSSQNSSMVMNMSGIHKAAATPTAAANAHRVEEQSHRQLPARSSASPQPAMVMMNNGSGNSDGIVTRNHRRAVDSLPGEGISLDGIEQNSDITSGFSNRFSGQPPPLPLFPTRTKATSSLTPLMDAFDQRLGIGLSNSSNNHSSLSQQHHHHQRQTQMTSSGIVKLNLFGSNNNDSSNGASRSSSAISAAPFRDPAAAAAGMTLKGGVLADRRGGVGSPGRDGRVSSSAAPFQAQQLGFGGLTSQHEQQRSSSSGSNNNPEEYLPSPPRQPRERAPAALFLQQQQQQQQQQPHVASFFTPHQQQQQSQSPYVVVPASNSTKYSNNVSGPAALSAPLRPSAAVSQTEEEVVELGQRNMNMSNSFSRSDNQNNINGGSNNANTSRTYGALDRPLGAPCPVSAAGRRAGWGGVNNSSFSRVDEEECAPLSVVAPRPTLPAGTTTTTAARLPHSSIPRYEDQFAENDRDLFPHSQMNMSDLLQFL